MGPIAGAVGVAGWSDELLASMAGNARREGKRRETIVSDVLSIQLILENTFGLLECPWYLPKPFENLRTFISIEVTLT
jgi:hypothetical protein